MNLTLPATASSVEFGLSLVADAVRSDLSELKYKTNDVIVTHCAHLRAAGLQNVHGFPWCISIFILVRGVETHYQASNVNIELAFQGLLSALPPASESNK